MRYNDIIGSAGVFMVLAAYFLNIFSLLPKEGKWFFILNIAGAALACYASLLINYVPFVVLEGTWCLVSVVAFAKKIYKPD